MERLLANLAGILIGRSSDSACRRERVRSRWERQTDEGRNERRNGFYLLSVTLDEAPPDFENRLRLYDRDGNRLGTRRRVFWLNRHKIEESLTPI